MKTQTGTMTKAQIAGAFGVSTQAVDGWIARGCPYEAAPDRPGKPYKFNLAAVVAWRTERLTETATAADGDVDLAEAKRRRAVAEAEMAELDLAQRRGELLAREDVDAAMIGAFARVRAKLLGIPSRCAPLVIGADPAKAATVLTDAVHEALSELATTTPDTLLGKN